MALNNRLIGILLTIVGLLAIPFIAMQFTSEVAWSASDFIIMGILLLTTGLSIEFGLRKVKTFNGRLILVGIIVFTFFLIWAELAVGVFGTPFAGS